MALLAAAAKPGTTILDIGANIGAMSVPLLAQFSDVRVVSFEPSPSVLPYLTRTRDECRFRDRWVVIPLAATAKAGQEISFVQFKGGRDVFDGIRNTGRGGRGLETRVLSTTVDTEWDALGRPPVSVMKIDVEGAELGVLGGADRCLRQCRPVVVTEWCAKNFVAYGEASEAMLDAANAAGYDVYVLPELALVTDRRLFDYQLATRENLLLLPRR